MRGTCILLKSVKKAGKVNFPHSDISHENQTLFSKREAIINWVFLRDMSFDLKYLCLFEDIFSEQRKAGFTNHRSLLGIYSLQACECRPISILNP